MDTTIAVRGHGITKVFGDVVALDHVDLNVAQGQIHGLVGPNGAGKTTLLGLMLGLAAADTGELEILGTPVGRGLPAPDGVSGFVDGPGLYPTLTARQNLATLLTLQPEGAPVGDVGEALAQVGLTGAADQKVRGFSLGMRQRLGLAAALLTRPRLLVLDEPSNGLDPVGKKHVHGVLRRLAAEGTTVVLSSHRMDDLEALCSEVTILSAGRVVFSGPVRKLSDDDRELDYRLRATDPSAARALAVETPGVGVVEGSDAALPDTDVIVVRARVAALDELVGRIVRADIAVRELAPVVSPLESAFLSLTEQAVLTEQSDKSEQESGR
ncbi:ABC transporter ATP-binding protein [Streptacidiphilus jiangxiensis]|uniref:ABC-2 type transport system ATP-binding protein n=1 Tax=Streptacidiphilus jiangxiensis TaxID=235985 RepID=A0A1H7HMC3_STRJI|nr:ABC transporter ATP-binding protein [Streptacidiphilus jiangxiensis]SEK51496.1 ABC-2 type transport system ATP-binding protein [Streptacidiphilus jiangxiensis]